MTHLFEETLIIEVARRHVMTSESDPISDIIAQLTKIARADGKITEEEEELLAEAQINLMTYDEKLDEALDDGVIDETEKDLLRGLKEQIIQGAWEMASLSDGISEDELNMLELLIKTVRNEG